MLHQPVATSPAVTGSRSTARLRRKKRRELCVFKCVVRACLRARSPPPPPRPPPPRGLSHSCSVPGGLAELMAAGKDPRRRSMDNVLFIHFCGLAGGIWLIFWELVAKHLTPSDPRNSERHAAEGKALERDQTEASRTEPSFQPRNSLNPGRKEVDVSYNELRPPP